MRSLVFARRNSLEILRDPLSFVFCLGFPLVMLTFFTVLYHFLDAPWFALNSLVPGICVFSLSFSMLFLAMLISKDKTTELLNRLFCSGMKGYEYFLGYILPMFLICLIQLLITIVVGGVLAAFTNQSYDWARQAASLILYLPPTVLFLSFAVILACIFNNKQASGISSVLISAAGILSGAWMPLEIMGSFATFCKCLPFYPSVYPSRALLSHSALTFENFYSGILVVCAYAILFLLLAIFLFGKMKSKDNK